jgi:hypothetical protein
MRSSRTYLHQIGKIGPQKRPCVYQRSRCSSPQNGVFGTFVPLQSELADKPTLREVQSQLPDSRSSGNLLRRRSILAPPPHALTDERCPAAPSQNLRNQDKDHADTHGSIEQFGDDRSQQQQRDNGTKALPALRVCFARPSWLRAESSCLGR